MCALPELHPAIELHTGDCAELEGFLADCINEFNANATGDAGESFAAVQRDESGAILGGVSGHTWGGVCFIANLWVNEAHRGTGLGAALLRAAEQNARAKGSTRVLLSSHSFQSPSFYAHLGYEALTTIDDYPLGHSDVLFSKRLSDG